MSQAVERCETEPLHDLLQSLHPSSFAWALVCCRWNRAEAEEVLQSAYLKAIDGRARFNGRSDARTWFFGVVRRTAQESRRRIAAQGSALRRLWSARPAIEAVPTPERVSGAGELRRRLRSLLARLSPRQRELLHLVFYEDMTIEQAAGVMRIPPDTARTHYKRGKARLRELLSKADGEDER